MSQKTLAPLPVNQRSDSFLDNLHVTEEDVLNVLKALDTDTCTGLDGIHPRFLKNLADYLARPLSFLFNTSLQEGRLPKEWIFSIVVPIYKSKSIFDPLNYRPVSLTSLVCKTLERVIGRHLMTYLEENNILTSHQYGFRAGYSTIDQLIVTYDDVTLDIDSGRSVNLIFFDYAKAFDKVSHRLLLMKLVDIGICPQLVNWIGEFLMQRVMAVRVAGVMSDEMPVLSGVPQGSVLDPILFLIYVNHVVNGLTCKFKVFADDIKIYISDINNSNMTPSNMVIQNDIDLLVRISASWGLLINSSKCKHICFGRRNIDTPSFNINNNPIETVESHGDLGVRIDKNLKFHAHINNTVGYLHALTTSILGCTLNRESSFIMNIYKSHIRPKIEYGSCVWNVGYLGDLRKLERLQKRWTRAVSDLAGQNYKERLDALDLYSIKGRLLRADMIYVWKIMHGYSSISPEDLFVIENSGRTRGHPLKIKILRSHQEIRSRFFTARVIAPWNALGSDTVMSESISKFKGHLHRDLGDKLYEFLD